MVLESMFAKLIKRNVKFIKMSNYVRVEDRMKNGVDQNKKNKRNESLLKTLAKFKVTL